MRRLSSETYKVRQLNCTSDWQQQKIEQQAHSTTSTVEKIERHRKMEMLGGNLPTPSNTLMDVPISTPFPIFLEHTATTKTAMT